MQVPVLLTLPCYITFGTSCCYCLFLASGMLLVHHPSISMTSSYSYPMGSTKEQPIGPNMYIFGELIVKLFVFTGDTAYARVPQGTVS